MKELGLARCASSGPTCWSFRWRGRSTQPWVRYILMYVKDPAAVLRDVSRLVRPGGVIAFLDVTVRSFLDACRDLPLWWDAAQVMTEVFRPQRREHGHGTGAVGGLRRRGPPGPGNRDVHADRCERWMSEYLMSLQPQFEALGVSAGNLGDLGTLQQRLMDEVTAERPPGAAPGDGGRLGPRASRPLTLLQRGAAALAARRTRRRLALAPMETTRTFLLDDGKIVPGDRLRNLAAHRGGSGADGPEGPRGWLSAHRHRRSLRERARGRGGASSLRTAASRPLRHHEAPPVRPRIRGHAARPRREPRAAWPRGRRPVPHPLAAATAAPLRRQLEGDDRAPGKGEGTLDRRFQASSPSMCRP